MKTNTTITLRQRWCARWQDDVHADNTCCAFKQCWNNWDINGVFDQHQRWFVTHQWFKYKPQKIGNTEHSSWILQHLDFDHVARNAAYIDNTCCPCLPSTPRTQARRSPHSKKKSRQLVLHMYTFFSRVNMLHQPWCQCCLLTTKQTSERRPVHIL